MGDGKAAAWILVGILVAILVLHTGRLSEAFFERPMKPVITTTTE